MLCYYGDVANTFMIDSIFRACYLLVPRTSQLSDAVAHLLQCYKSVIA